MGATVSIPRKNSNPQEINNTLQVSNHNNHTTAITPRVRNSNNQKFQNGEDIEDYLLMVYSRGNISENISSILAYKQSRFHFLSYIENQDSKLYDSFCHVS
jgi:hypothetical protein